MVEKSDFARSAPYWLRRVGVVSWLFLGVVLAATVVFGALAVLSGITTPLLVAVMVGSLFRPGVGLLEQRRLPRTLGTILTMAAILLGIVLLIIILVQGIVLQSPEIARQLEAGWIRLRLWLLQFPIVEPSTIESLRTAAINGLPALFLGGVGLLGSTFSSVAGLLIGLFFGLFILFFILQDGPNLETWLARQLSLPPETSTAIVANVGRCVRLYYRGIALTAAMTSLVVVIPLVFLNVPLVGSIFLIYFFSSFIPYLGAWIAGAFAVLIAFGAGGAQTALITTVLVFVSNGAVQSAVSSWTLGSSLKLHPLLVFLVTIAAGVVGGILAMIVAVPLTASVVQTVARLREEGVFAEE